MTVSFRSASIFASLAGAAASVLMLVAVATDHWEKAEYSIERLKAIANVNVNASYFDVQNGFYKLVETKTELASVSPSNAPGNATITVHVSVRYVRANYGGIWKICDRVSESFRKTQIYREAMEGNHLLRYTCFNYIPDYGVIRAELHEHGVSLVRMQNSAASCNIVSVMCLSTAAVIGIIGLWRKQVSACMVTGVIYVVAEIGMKSRKLMVQRRDTSYWRGGYNHCRIYQHLGVFGCFSLIIMLTKVGYMQRECYSLDPLGSDDICRCRDVTTGWSVLVAWLAFTLFLVAFASWLFLSRVIRLEKAKSVA